MFDDHRRVPPPLYTDPTNQKWGEDRREADAFIMTQLAHSEKRLEDIASLIVFSVIAYFAYHEGYKSLAFGAVFIMVLRLVVSGYEIKMRHASVSKLMDRD